MLPSFCHPVASPASRRTSPKVPTRPALHARPKAAGTRVPLTRSFGSQNSPQGNSKKDHPAWLHQWSCTLTGGRSRRVPCQTRSGLSVAPHRPHQRGSRLCVSFYSSVRKGHEFARHLLMWWSSGYRTGENPVTNPLFCPTWGVVRGKRVKGIEPSYAAWEAAVLPLNYTRVDGEILTSPGSASSCHLPPALHVVFKGDHRANRSVHPIISVGL